MRYSRPHSDGQWILFAPTSHANRKLITGEDVPAHLPCRATYERMKERTNGRTEGKLDKAASDPVCRPCLRPLAGGPRESRQPGKAQVNPDWLSRGGKIQPRAVILENCWTATAAAERLPRSTNQSVTCGFNLKRLCQAGNVTILLLE